MPATHLELAKRAELRAKRHSCGWQHDQPSLARVTIASDGEPSWSGGAPGVSLVVDADDSVPFGRAKRSILPHVSRGLVRIKVIVAAGELLALTVPRKPAMPAPSKTVVSIVGTQQVTRIKGAPRDRLGQLLLDGDKGRLYIENDEPRGRIVSLADLADVLRSTKPPMRVFALSASHRTRWGDYRRAVLALACFDRRAGQEAHEVLFVDQPAVTTPTP